MNTESTKTQEKKLETLEEATMNVLNEDFFQSLVTVIKETATKATDDMAMNTFYEKIDNLSREMFLYKTGENSVFNDSDSMTNAINEIESLYKEAIPALQQIQQMVNNSEAAKITDRLARILSRGFCGVDGTSKNPLTNIIRSKGEADAPTHWQDKLYK